VTPACAPRLLEGRQPERITDILDYPLLHIVWNSTFSPAPSWADWARSIGVDRPAASPGLSYTLSSSAIDAAVSGRGFVLGQMSMIADELESGRLVIPFDHRLKLSESYYLAWSRSSLEKPFGPQFKQWITATGRRQAELSAPAG
jgi:LysR family glycine cleavage system transcriptional activator